MSKRKRKTRPKKRPLGEGIRRVRDAQREELNKLSVMLDGINEAHNHMWNNQRLLQTGLGAAEDHIILLRRVFNDALCGVTRFASISRKIESGKDEMEETQVIDWDWYAMQLDFSDDRKEFMLGTIVPEEAIQIKSEARRVALAKHAEEIFRNNLKSLDKSIMSMLRKRADEFHPLLDDDEKFREKVKSIYGHLDEKLFEAACGMIRTKLENAPSPEEMESEAAALQERFKRVAEEALKREKGEPYDEELLAAADAEIASMEAEDASNPYPEGASIFGGS